MSVRGVVRFVFAMAFAGGLWAGTANGQGRAPAAPSAAAIAAAKEIMAIKDGLRVFEPIVLGVIEQHKSLLEQANPMMSRDLNEVASRLRVELSPRRAELDADIIKIYAQAFTEQELKDLLAFYRSPLGKKVIEQEPLVLDSSMARASEWADKLAQEVVQKLRVEMRKKGHNL
jgi:uncharacterized protein